MFQWTAITLPELFRMTSIGLPAHFCPSYQKHSSWGCGPKTSEVANSPLIPCSQWVWRCCGEHSAASNIPQHDQCGGFLFLDGPAEFLAGPNSARCLLLLLQHVSLPVWVWKRTQARHRSSGQHFTCWVWDSSQKPSSYKTINLI